MRVAITIQHPGHVHFFKHVVSELENRGHTVAVFARESECAVELLERYGIDHEVLANESDSLLSLATVQLTYETRLLLRARRFNPDVIAAIGGVAAAHVAPLVGAKSTVFYDTEHAKFVTKLAYPFADVICTPECYGEDVGTKQIRYPGYHELAYLHPDRFEPDPSVFDATDLSPTDTYAVVRFSSWEASHDVGQGGFDDLQDVVDRLEETGARVVITAEGDLPAELESRRLTTSPDQMHDLLAYANVVVGEGATTAAEAAVLGTPSVYVNSLALGYTTELDERYGLLFSFNDEDRHAKSIETAIAILEEDDSETWARRRDRLLEERIDVTDVAVREIETAGGQHEEDSSPVPASAG